MEDDDTLISYFLDGDEEAFNKIVKRYSSKIINFFFRLCWQRELSEELTQDVFIKVYLSIDQYSAHGNFKAYIYKIAKNLWIDFLRSKNGKKRLAKKEIHDDILLKNLKTRYDSAEECLLYKEKLELLKKTLDSLPENQKMVFILYQSDMSHSEIAQVLNIPEGTVKSRLHTVFNKIKKLYLKIERSQLYNSKGILLDRDGVLIKDRKNYTKNISEVEILPGTQEAISLLWDYGYTVCVVTNQSGVSKGLYTHKNVKDIHQFIENQLTGGREKKIHWYYCPHQDTDNCDCRKPKAGLLQQAIEEHFLLPENTWMVGDNIRDIEAGKTLGCPTCLVLTGLGKNFYGEQMNLVPEKVYCDLYEFVEKVIKEGETVY